VLVFDVVKCDDCPICQSRLTDYDLSDCWCLTFDDDDYMHESRLSEYDKDLREVLSNRPNCSIFLSRNTIAHIAFFFRSREEHEHSLTWDYETIVNNREMEKMEKMKYDVDEMCSFAVKLSKLHALLLLSHDDELQHSRFDMCLSRRLRHDPDIVVKKRNDDAVKLYLYIRNFCHTNRHMSFTFEHGPIKNRLDKYYFFGSKYLVDGVN